MTRHEFFSTLWFRAVPCSHAILTQSKSKAQITRSVHGKFNCIPIDYDSTQHGMYTTWKCINKKYMHLIRSTSQQFQWLPERYIHSFNLVYTFYDSIHHIYMSPISHMKILLHLEFFIFKTKQKGQKSENKRGLILVQGSL